MVLPAGAHPSRAFVTEAGVLAMRAVRVLFGAGTLRLVPAEARRLGSRILIVAGAHEDEPAAEVARGLGANLVGRLRDVGQHVPVDMVATALASARAVNADVLLALGGGSATGLAKAVALESGLPVLAVPTTYAGSEMTSIWGRTDEHGKTTGRDPRVLPRTVVYDPLLSLSLPSNISAASGMNALAHALEGLYAPDADPQTSTRAAEAIRCLVASLPGVRDDPRNLASRTEAMYGAWLAGWVLGSTTMGLHHKIAHVLGGSHRLPHAGVHSALLPHVAAFNAAAAPKAFALAAEALAARDAGDVASTLFSFATDIGAPTALAALGLRREALERVAVSVTEAPVSNPRPFSTAQVTRLLQDAHAGRRPEPASDVHFPSHTEHHIAASSGGNHDRNHA